jgi:hypothetical protein
MYHAGHIPHRYRASSSTVGLEGWEPGWVRPFD